MADLPGGRGRTLALSAKYRHDALCDDFERDWKAGARVPIEKLLAGVPSAERPFLLEQLLRQELELRQLAPASSDEYRVRFPEFGDVVELVFHGPSGDLSGISDAIHPFAPPSIPGIEIL